MPDAPLPVPDALRYEVLRRSPEAGARWLNDLPSRCARLCRRWGLRIDGPPAHGAAAIVVPVAGPGGRYALKLISPWTDAAAERAALEAFAGDGAARLLDADEDAAALLIEWLPGPPLITEPDRVAAMRIAGELAGRLGRTPAPAGTRTLAAGAADWRQELMAQHAAAEAAGEAFSDELLALALDAVDELATDRTRTLTHGDLSLDNILAAGPGRWVAIDPLLLIGTVAHDVHTIARSQLGAVITDPDPAGRLDALTREVTRAAGVDHGWAQRLSLARYVASAYWEAQHDGEAANVHRLRAAVLITARLVGRA
ncbi:aminoglycoside phosphotransferase family protein [Microlunatus speluncae]|uniref:aminoglycoside phosphotransferase family protein n=1 Tax=Microlunatus speluncae TaxID=2594267 RepID=UPI001375DF33|nr:aminoglycoside phosphotransferase family protein [Microlunatus speluncae]